MKSQGYKNYHDTHALIESFQRHILQLNELFVPS